MDILCKAVLLKHQIQVLNLFNGRSGRSIKKFKKVKLNSECWHYSEEEKGTISKYVYWVWSLDEFLTQTEEAQKCKYLVFLDTVEVKCKYFFTSTVKFNNLGPNKQYSKIPEPGSQNSHQLFPNNTDGLQTKYF